MRVVCAAAQVELPARFVWRSYRQILGQHAVPRESPPIPAAFWWGLGGVVAALLLALAFVALLKREVGRRTAELRASEDKLSTILNSVDAFIYIKDPDLRYLYANPSATEGEQATLYQPVYLGVREDAEGPDSFSSLKLRGSSN